MYGEQVQHFLIPTRSQHAYDREEEEKASRFQLQTAIVTPNHAAPPYGQRKGWIPRTAEDFGDGGAFPEILVAQHPLGMGLKKSSSNALTKRLDASGKVKYDAIAKYSYAMYKVVHSKSQDLVPKTMCEGDPELERPDDDAVRETTEKTKNALEQLVQSKIAASLPVRAADKTSPAQYIRYTPSQQGVAFNSGAKQRIISMVEVQKDPMKPPHFKTNKKIPRGPPSPPSPVMHSPNRKVMVKEQQEWKIPPCISNWKNAKGYTIPLDKRLAADGRGLQQTHINENFSKLAESLYITGRKAREELEMKAQIEKKMEQREKEKTEDTLKQLAAKARQERAGIKRVDEHNEDVRERDDLRQDRAKERQRDRNLARAAPDKRNRLHKECERDISEKVALGLPAVGRSDELQVDMRLYNQSKGLDSGYAGGEDDSYNVYNQAWRKDKDMASNIYRPSKNAHKGYGEDLDKIIQSNRFVPGRGFAGTDRSAKRDGPVQFKKDEEEDPFGIKDFLTRAKRAPKRLAEDGHSSSRSDNRKSYKKRRE